MNPPFSIIFFTTLSGMGQGLFLAVYLAFFQSSNKISPEFFIAANLLTLALLTIGLIASVAHLGHPERAWRSAARWRTSWLSREVIALPVLMFLVFLCLLISYFPGLNPTITQFPFLTINPLFLLSTFTLPFVFVLFICTGMIYACIRFLQEWATPLTNINFILLGCCSGFTLAATVALILAPTMVQLFSIIAIVLTICAAISRGISLVRNKRLRPKSTIQTALGIPYSKIVQKAQGSMNGSFNTREFFHGKTKLFIRSIKRIFITLVFVIPCLLLVLQLFLPQAPFAMLALIFQYAGLLCERWYFFAEAKHPQNLYYQAIS